MVAPFGGTLPALITLKLIGSIRQRALKKTRKPLMIEGFARGHQKLVKKSPAVS
jgi:hypothetical protein